MYFPMFVGVMCLSLYALLCVLSSFCNHLKEEERAGCFSFVVLQMYCYYKCSVALLSVPRVGLQCVTGIS